MNDSLRIQGMLNAVAEDRDWYRRRQRGNKRTRWPTWAPMLTSDERAEMNQALLARLADYILIRNLRDYTERAPYSTRKAHP